MNLYATTYVDDADDDYPDKVKWYGTQALQKAGAKALKAEGMREIHPQAVNVPTDKAGLLQFLNEHGVRP